jgi:hypothetical protein
MRKTVTLQFIVLFATALSLLFAGCKKEADPEATSAKKEQVEEKATKDSGDWRRVEYGTVAEYKVGKKMPYAHFTIMHTGTRRDKAGEGVSVEFRVFKLWTANGPLPTIEWLVGSSEPMKILVDQEEFLIEVECKSAVSDYILEAGQLIVWTQKSLAKELIEEKKTEKAQEKWEENQKK